MSNRTLNAFVSWTLIFALILSFFLQTSRAQFADDDIVNELLLRRFRRESYGRSLDGLLEPKRFTRHIDYSPTPCRWKLCASLFRN